MGEYMDMKSGPEIVREFITKMEEDKILDIPTIKVIKDLLENEGKLSANKLETELEKLR